MAVVELRRYIAAPRERVWRIATDVHGQTRWMEDLHSLELVAGEGLGPGAVMKARSRLFGLPVLRDVMRVITWEPPRLLEVVHEGQFSGTAAFRLLPAGGGGTVFVWREQYDPPLGRLGEIAARMVVSPHLARVWGRSLDSLKALAEGTQA